MPKAEQVVPRNGSHDAEALSLAVLAATNTARCDKGLPPLDPDPALRAAATRYSGEMAERDFFSHQSPVEGRETLRKRADDAGIGNVRIAENLITGFYVDYPGGAPYQVVNAGECKFRNSETDEIFPRMTYARMGQTLVDRWLDSPGHRANLLGEGLTRHGFGIARDPDQSALCGEFIGTQLFAGD